MLISSHIGTIILVIVGYISILAIILIGILETHRKEKGLPPMVKPSEQPPEKKREQK